MGDDEGQLRKRSQSCQRLPSNQRLLRRSTSLPEGDPKHLPSSSTIERQGDPAFSSSLSRSSYSNVSSELARLNGRLIAYQNLNELKAEQASLVSKLLTEGNKLTQLTTKYGETIVEIEESIKEYCEKCDQLLDLFKDKKTKPTKEELQQSTKELTTLLETIFKNAENAIKEKAKTLHAFIAADIKRYPNVTSWWEGVGTYQSEYNHHKQYINDSKNSVIENDKITIEFLLNFHSFIQRQEETLLRVTKFASDIHIYQEQNKAILETERKSKKITEIKHKYKEIQTLLHYFKAFESWCEGKESSSEVEKRCKELTGNTRNQFNTYSLTALDNHLKKQQALIKKLNSIKQDIESSKQERTKLVPLDDSSIRKQLAKYFTLWKTLSLTTLNYTNPRYRKIAPFVLAIKPRTTSSNSKNEVADKKDQTLNNVYELNRENFEETPQTHCSQKQYEELLNEQIQLKHDIKQQKSILELISKKRWFNTKNDKKIIEAYETYLESLEVEISYVENLVKNRYPFILLETDISADQLEELIKDNEMLKKKYERLIEKSSKNNNILRQAYKELTKDDNISQQAYEKLIEDNETLKEIYENLKKEHPAQPLIKKLQHTKCYLDFISEFEKKYQQYKPSYKTIASGASIEALTTLIKKQIGLKLITKKREDFEAMPMTIERHIVFLRLDYYLKNLDEEIKTTYYLLIAQYQNQFINETLNPTELKNLRSNLVERLHFDFQSELSQLEDDATKQFFEFLKTSYIDYLEKREKLDSATKEEAESFLNQQHEFELSIKDETAKLEEAINSSINKKPTLEKKLNSIVNFLNVFAKSRHLMIAEGGKIKTAILLDHSQILEKCQNYISEIGSLITETKEAIFKKYNSKKDQKIINNVAQQLNLLHSNQTSENIKRLIHHQRSFWDKIRVTLKAWWKGIDENETLIDPISALAELNAIEKTNAELKRHDSTTYQNLENLVAAPNFIETISNRHKAVLRQFKSYIDDLSLSEEREEDLTEPFELFQQAQTDYQESQKLMEDAFILLDETLLKRCPPEQLFDKIQTVFQENRDTLTTQLNQIQALERQLKTQRSRDELEDSLFKRSKYLRYFNNSTKAKGLVPNESPSPYQPR